MRQVADSSGGVLLAQTFDPYGSPYSPSIASSWPGDTSFGFAGEYTDANGLVFLRARYYNPTMGRFFQLDPSRQETNPYQYGFANPVKYVDPSGYDPYWCEDIADPVARKTCILVHMAKTTNYDIGSCYGDEFCEKYGQVIADRAHLLDVVSFIPSGASQAANIYPVVSATWGGYWKLGLTLGYACTDVIKDAYHHTGIDLANWMWDELGAEAYSNDQD